MPERTLGVVNREGPCPADEVLESLAIEMCRNAEQRADARLFHVLGTQQRVKVPVPAVPATVILALQTVRLDLGVNDHSRVVADAISGADDAQLEVMVFDR